MQTFTTEKIITSLKRQVYTGEKSTFETIAPLSAFTPLSFSSGAVTTDNLVTVHNVPNATGRLMLVGFQFNNDTYWISSIKFNGQDLSSMSDFGEGVAEYMPNKLIHWYYLYNPPVGTFNLEVLLAGGGTNFAYIVAAYGGIDIAGGDPIVNARLDNATTPTTFNITPTYANSALVALYGAETLAFGTSGQTVQRAYADTADNHRLGWVDSGIVYPDTNAHGFTFLQTGGAETGGVLIAALATTLAGEVLTCYLRPLNEEQSSVNGVQYGLGFMVIVECNVDIQQGDKLEIEGKEYTVRGVVNHDRGGYTAYKRAVVTLPEKQL